MNFFSPKNKSYLIKKPYSEVIDYLNTLEEKRKFQSDIYGGLEPGTSDEYVFAPAFFNTLSSWVTVSRVIPTMSAITL